MASVRPSELTICDFERSVSCWHPVGWVCRTSLLIGDIANRPKTPVTPRSGYIWTMRGAIRLSSYSMLKLNWNLDDDVSFYYKQSVRLIWAFQLSHPCVLISIGINCAFGMLPSLSIKEFFHLYSFFFFLYILKFSLGGWLDGWLYSRRLHGIVCVAFARWKQRRLKNCYVAPWAHVGRM